MIIILTLLSKLVKFVCLNESFFRK